MMRSFSAAVLIVGSAASHAAGFFPMHPGEKWTYTAEVKWTVENSSEVKSDKVVWLTRVEKVAESQGTRIGIIRGLPMQLAWYEPGKTRSLDVVAERPDGLWIAGASSDEEANTLAERFAKGETSGTQILKYPVKIGDCAGKDDPQPTDNSYCWSVEEAIDGPGGKKWRLAYRSRPDYQEIEFVPGIGIGRYEYLHHGTVAQASAVLQVHSFDNP